MQRVKAVLYELSVIAIAVVISFPLWRATPIYYWYPTWAFLGLLSGMIGFGTHGWRWILSLAPLALGAIMHMPGHWYDPLYDTATLDFQAKLYVTSIILDTVLCFAAAALGRSLRAWWIRRA